MKFVKKEFVENKEWNTWNINKNILFYDDQQHKSLVYFKKIQSVMKAVWFTEYLGG